MNDGGVDLHRAHGKRYDEATDTDADEYGVSLARSNLDETDTEIVRLDTAHGQDPHMDLVYLPPGADFDKRVELDEHYTYDRMKQFRLTHWEDFVDGYIYSNE